MIIITYKLKIKVMYNSIIDRIHYKGKINFKRVNTY